MNSHPPVPSKQLFERLFDSGRLGANFTNGQPGRGSPRLQRKILHVYIHKSTPTLTNELHIIYIYIQNDYDSDYDAAPFST